MLKGQNKQSGVLNRYSSQNTGDIKSGHDPAELASRSTIRSYQNRQRSVLLGKKAADFKSWCGWLYKVAVLIFFSILHGITDGDVQRKQGVVLLNGGTEPTGHGISREQPKIIVLAIDMFIDWHLRQIMGDNISGGISEGARRGECVWKGRHEVAHGRLLIHQRCQLLHFLNSIVLRDRNRLATEAIVMLDNVSQIFQNSQRVPVLLDNWVLLNLCVMKDITEAMKFSMIPAFKSSA